MPQWRNLNALNGEGLKRALRIFSPFAAETGLSGAGCQHKALLLTLVEPSCPQLTADCFAHKHAEIGVGVLVSQRLRAYRPTFMGFI